METLYFIQRGEEDYLPENPVIVKPTISLPEINLSINDLDDGCTITPEYFTKEIEAIHKKAIDRILATNNLIKYDYEDFINRIVEEYESKLYLANRELSKKHQELTELKEALKVINKCL